MINTYIDGLTINNQVAATTFGVYLDELALTSRMTPAPNKEFISSESRLEHGKVVLPLNPRKDSREFSIQLNMSASNFEDFLSKYALLCKEFDKGTLNLTTRFQPDVVYKLYFLKCTQFSQYFNGIAKFILQVEEPNPYDRSL